MEAPDAPLRNKRLGIAALIACALLWSSAGLCIKLLDWHPMAIACARSAIAFLLLFFVRLWRHSRKKTPPPADTSARRWLAAAGCCYAVTLVGFVVANRLTTSANAIFLQYSAPVWAALFGWLICHERPRAKHWACLAAMLLGMACFFGGSLAAAKGPAAFWGDALAVLTGVAFGATSVFMRKAKSGDAADCLLLAHGLAALAASPWLFLYPPANLDAASLAAIGFLGLAQVGLASLLFAYGIKRLPAVEAVLICVLEPVLNPVWVLLFVGERPSASAFLGGAIIVCAVVASQVQLPLRAFAFARRENR
jgi:drug/metabolite transporter (DMT)-like permease